MGIRTVRLDQEAQKALTNIIAATGLSASAAMKKALLALRDTVVHEPRRLPYDVYKELDLGPGGYAIAPATQTDRGVRSVIRRKLGR